MDIAFAEDHIAFQCVSCTSDKRASAILQWSSTLQPFHWLMHIYICIYICIVGALHTPSPIYIYTYIYICIASSIRCFVHYTNQWFRTWRSVRSAIWTLHCGQHTSTWASSKDGAQAMKDHLYVYVYIYICIRHSIYIYTK